MSQPTISLPLPRRTSTDSQNSVTAMDYINSQLALENEAREIMPYSFDACTNPLGPLRQPVFSCKTCQSTATTSPPFAEFVSSGAAGICYSCSISCHGDHELVEIFNKRDVVCDCGTDRMPQGSSCSLRKVAGEKGRVGNRYCHNYWGRFCACDADYDPESERGTMYQCLLGDACGEDWFHDSCIIGEKREEKVVVEAEAEAEAPPGAVAEGTNEATLEGAVEGAAEDKVEQTETAQDGDEDEDEEPLVGFPEEESFEHYICWLCVEKNPWLKRYAGTPGFLPPIYKKDAPLPAISTSTPITTDATPTNTNDKKRKADDDDTEADTEVTKPELKRAKTPDAATTLSPPSPKDALQEPTPCTYTLLPPTRPSTLHHSLFLTPTFRTHLCHCASCFPLLAPHPCLLEEEESYEPPLDNSSRGDGDGASVHSGGSLFDRGERALGMVDRVQAIEGVMAYNHLKEKVKDFLKPFAERGEAVGVEDVKKYFAELRGDAPVPTERKEENEGAARKEQSGY